MASLRSSLEIEHVYDQEMIFNADIISRQSNILSIWPLKSIPIHSNPFKLQPDPPILGSKFSRLCEHMAQLSIRKSHPFGTAFPFERLSYGRIGLPFVNTFQSKRGSIRNGFGITPRGPVGPSPPRAPKAPFGTLGHPGVPLGPLGSTPRDRHPVEATERRLESLVAKRLYRREDTGSAACA